MMRRAKAPPSKCSVEARWKRSGTTASRRKRWHVSALRAQASSSLPRSELVASCSRQAGMRPAHRSTRSRTARQQYYSAPLRTGRWWRRGSGPFDRRHGWCRCSLPRRRSSIGERDCPPLQRNRNAACGSGPFTRPLLPAAWPRPGPAHSLPAPPHLGRDQSSPAPGGRPDT